MKKRRHFGVVVILLIAASVVSSIMLSACSCGKERAEESLSTLRIGIVPDESQEQLLSRFTPLAEYLSAEIGVPYELIVPANYAELLALFRAGKVDLVNFGGFTFVKAHIFDDATPLVMRDVDARFTSFFLVRGDHPAKELAEFKGRRFSFGSELSTSGHLMPRYFLAEKGIIPEAFFGEVRYSGRHDTTALWVRDDKVELGVANAAIVRKMYKDGRLNEEDVRVLWETPPYPDYVWALRPVFDKPTRITIRDAFLNLSRADETHAEILDRVDAGSFLPAGADDFSQLREIVENLQLLEPER